MEVTLNKGKIAGVVKAAGESVSNRGFETPEVLFGLAELIGRILVDHAGGTIVQKLEMLKPIVEHAERTVRVGCIAKS